MRRHLLNAALIVAYFAMVLAIAAAHYATVEAFWPSKDGVHGPMAGATLGLLVIAAALPFVRLWRRRAVEADGGPDDPSPGADDE